MVIWLVASSVPCDLLHSCTRTDVACLLQSDFGITSHGDEDALSVMHLLALITDDADVLLTRDADLMSPPPHVP